MSGRDAKPRATASDARDIPASAMPLDTSEGTMAALSAVGCAVYRWDLATDRLTWSPNVDAVLGADAASQFSSGHAFLEACGLRTRSAGHHGFDADGITAPADGVAYEAVCRLRRHGDADPCWIMDQGRWFASPDDPAPYAIGTIHLMRSGLAQSPGRGVDALTGMPTRRRLAETLDAMLRGEHGQWALMLVGIDDLGRINERFGFEAADQLILALARHLRARLKEEDLLVRFSGNKFAILLAEASICDLSAYGEALIADIRHTPLSTNDGQIPVSVTIGAIAASPAILDAAQIISRMQEAHERAKRRGRGRFYLDERTSSDDTRRRINLKMADEIVQALEQDRVFVALQPVVHAASRELAFSEALARIPPEPSQHRYGGQRLVAAAEKLGLMGGLDRRVLHKVVDAMRRDPGLRLSVNVSASSLADDEWMRLYRDEVDEDIGARLIIELTESVAVDDLSAARQFISKVRKAGARIAIDDFGAGATSFRNLRRLDVDIVKIDGSFVLHMFKSSDDRAFVQALLTLTRQLGLQSVAEWVQNETAAAMLLEWGCDYFQGALSGLAQPLMQTPSPSPEAED